MIHMLSRSPPKRGTGFRALSTIQIFARPDCRAPLCRSSPCEPDIERSLPHLLLQDQIFHRACHVGNTAASSRQICGQRKCQGPVANDIQATCREGAGVKGAEHGFEFWLGMHVSPPSGNEVEIDSIPRAAACGPSINRSTSIRMTDLHPRSGIRLNIRRRIPVAASIRAAAGRHRNLGKFRASTNANGNRMLGTVLARVASGEIPS